MPTPQQYDVFLSHNSQDKPDARKLAEALKAVGISVWFDEWCLVPGRPWQEALEQAIVESKAMAVLVGQSGIGPWEDMEMRAGIDKFVKTKRPVIPVLLPGAPQKPDLPLFLQAFTWVDLRQGLSPDGINRLVWGITGNNPASTGTPPSPNPGFPKP